MGKNAIKLYRDRKDRGLCPRCGRIPAKGYVFCDVCLERGRKANAKYAKRYKQECQKVQQEAQQKTPLVIYIDDEPAPTPAPVTQPTPWQTPRKWPYAEEYTAVAIKNTRKCHDCGKATNNYRCPSCLAKWREKHGVTSCDFSCALDPINL